MALRSALRRYKTMSRPSMTTGGQSSYMSTLAKKTQAAEDDVVDHNYDSGLLSADAYLNELSKRIARPGLTPLQITNFRQKIEAVTNSYNDSIMQNNYKNGQVTDRQMYDYEAAKLGKMSASEGAAYQTQAAKVAGLLDKAQKTERKDYRLSEMLKISKMPEDNSARIQTKANLYKTLWDQALADGDQADATAFETSYNNYSLGAQKAAVSDMVNKTMADIAGNNQNYPYYTDANGNPVDTSGNSIEGTPAPVAGSGAAVGGVGATSSPTGASAGAGVSSTYSDAVASAQEAYRKAVIRDQNIQQDMGNTQTQIATLQDAQKKYKAMGAVDQADAVGMQIVNLQNRLADLKDFRAGNIQTIGDAQTRIREAQKAAAYQSVYTKNQDAENQILDAEQNNDLMLQNGRITKQEYLNAKREIIQQKVNLYKDYGDMYQTFDKTNANADMARKAQKEEMTNLRTIDVQKNSPGRYELVEDTNGNITLTDVYSQKVAKTFDSNYLKDGEVYRRVYTTGAVDANGNPLGLSTSTAKALALQGDLAGNDTSFVTKVVNGQLVELPVSLVDGKPYYKIDVQNLLKTGKVKMDPSKGYQMIKASGPNPLQAMGDTFGRNMQKTKDALAGIAGAVPGAVRGVGQGILDTSPAYRQSQGKKSYQYTTVAVPDLKKIFGGATDSVMKLLRNVQKNPQVRAVEQTVQKSPLEALGIKGANAGTILQNIGQGVGNLISRFTPKVQAKGQPAMEKPLVQQSGFPVAKTWDEMVKQAAQIAYEYGIPPEVMISQMALESGHGTSPRSKRNQLFGVGVYNDNSPGYQYNSPEASMRGYAELISKDPRYAQAYAQRNDPAAMIREIKKAGYAADPNYVYKITNMPEFRAKYDQYKPAIETPVLDATSVAPTQQTSWYDNIVKGVKSLLPGQVQAAGPAQSSAIRSSTPNISPAIASIRPSISSPTFTPTFAQTPSSSAQLRTPTPTPSIKLPSIPSYNPIQTFQSNVQKARSAVQNVAKAVGSGVRNAANTVKNVFSKFKFW